MPIEHRKYLTYNADEFIRWAESVREYTARVVRYSLSVGREPEQGYKSCASLTKLGDRYGHERLESACRRVLQYSSQPAIRNISTILKNGQNKMKDVKKSAPASKNHGITRGAAHFQRRSEQA